MANRFKDAPEIIADIVAGIERTFIIELAIDLVTAPKNSYRLDTCDTMWLRAKKKITIDGKEYKIISFLLNQNIVVEEITVGDGIPTVDNFEIPAPFFFHGTPTAASQQQKEKKLPADRLPFIWLREIVDEERNRDLDDPIGNIINAKLYFLDETNNTDNTPLQYSRVVRPMDQLQEDFIDVIEEETGTFQTEEPPIEYTSRARPKFGKDDVDFGALKQFFNEPLSGRELDIEIRVFNSGCIDCNPKDINVCTLQATIEGTNPTTIGGNDGTATANFTLEKGTVTFLWDDPLNQTTQTAIDLIAGDYECIVTDDFASGCNKKVSIELTDPSEILLLCTPKDLDTINGGGASLGDPIITIDDLSTFNDGLDQPTPGDRPVADAFGIDFRSFDGLRNGSARFNISGAMTQYFWYNSDGTGNQAIMGKWNGVGGQRSWIADILSTTLCFLVSPDGVSSVAVDSGVILTPGTNYFCAMQHDPGLDKIRITATQEGAGSIAAFVEASHSIGMFISTADFEIGRNNALGADGQMGIFSVIAAVRTLSELNTIFLAGP